MTKEHENKVLEFTRNYYRYALDSDGFGFKRYVDYRDEFPKDIINKVLSSDFPRDTFYELIDDMEINAFDWDYETEFRKELDEFCSENDIDTDDANNFIVENFYWHYPDYFLNPTFNAVVEIDTGDGNYDFTLHNECNYYSTAGYGHGKLDKKAGLYWLAKQQRRLGLLQKEIAKSDRYSNGNCEESRFVSSCITELVNLSSHMASLSFLVKMKLQEAINIL